MPRKRPRRSSDGRSTASSRRPRMWFTNGTRLPAAPRATAAYLCNMYAGAHGLDAARISLAFRGRRVKLETRLSHLRRAGIGTRENQLTIVEDADSTTTAGRLEMWHIYERSGDEDSGEAMGPVAATGGDGAGAAPAEEIGDGPQWMFTAESARASPELIEQWATAFADAEKWDEAANAVEMSRKAWSRVDAIQALKLLHPIPGTELQWTANLWSRIFESPMIAKRIVSSRNQDIQIFAEHAKSLFVEDGGEYKDYHRSEFADKDKWVVLPDLIIRSDFILGIGEDRTDSDKGSTEDDKDFARLLISCASAVQGNIVANPECTSRNGACVVGFLTARQDVQVVQVTAECERAKAATGEDVIVISRFVWRRVCRTTLERHPRQFAELDHIVNTILSALQATKLSTTSSLVVCPRPPKRRERDLRSTTTGGDRRPVGAAVVEDLVLRPKFMVSSSESSDGGHEGTNERAGRGGDDEDKDGSDEGRGGHTGRGGKGGKNSGKRGKKRRKRGNNSGRTDRKNSGKGGATGAGARDTLFRGPGMSESGRTILEPVPWFESSVMSAVQKLRPSARVYPLRFTRKTAVFGLVTAGGSKGGSRAEPAGTGAAISRKPEEHSVIIKTQRAASSESTHQCAGRELIVLKALEDRSCAPRVQWWAASHGLVHVALEHLLPLKSSSLASSSLASPTDHGRRPELRDKLAVTIKLFECVAQIHSVGIAHMDIKPDHVLVRATDAGEEELVLIDYDYASSELFGLPSFPAVGTQGYQAPEAHHILPGDDLMAVDVWAAGVTAAELLCGRQLGAVLTRKERTHPDLVVMEEEDLEAGRMLRSPRSVRERVLAAVTECAAAAVPLFSTILSLAVHDRPCAETVCERLRRLDCDDVSGTTDTSDSM